jgi:Ca-activated chloride channel homolog
MQQLEEKFLELIEGQIEEPDARNLRSEIQSDADLSRAFKEVSDIHASLRALSGQVFAIDRLFKEDVMEKVLLAARPTPGRGPLAIIAALVIVGLGVFGSLSSGSGAENTIAVILTVLEGSFGALLVLAFAAGVLLTAATRRFRWSAALAACCFACFVLRSTVTTFYNTESVAGLDGGYGAGHTFQRVGKSLAGSNMVYNDERIDGAVSDLLKLFSPRSDPASTAGSRQKYDVHDGSQDAFKGTLERLAETESSVSNLTQNRQTSPSWPQLPSNASFTRQNEQPAILTDGQPASTFSFDVDTASYSLVRKYLVQGQLPPPDAVRTEELVNYFDYNYPNPESAAFGISPETAPSPFSKGKYLLRIGLKAKSQSSDDRPWNLVFLLDVSGSMADEDKLPLIKRSFETLIAKLRPSDRIAIVTYSDTASVVLDSIAGSEKLRIRSAIERLHAGGSTNGADGIDLAYQIAARNFIPSGVNRVILATDGDFNVGRYSLSQLMQLAKEKLQSGVSLTALGVGNNNLKDDKLEQLASNGDGNYYFLDSGREAEKVFGGSLAATIEAVAKDVKGQVEFNSAYVERYRLLGYNNRVISREEFYNQKTHAAEVGSGQSLTLLYELTLKTAAFAEPKPEGKQSELAFITVKYKEPSGTSKEQAAAIPISLARDKSFHPSQDFLFAAAVAQFAETLSESRQAPLVPLSEVERLAKSTIGPDPNGYRSEFVEMVAAAKRLRGDRVEVPAGRYEQ